MDKGSDTLHVSRDSTSDEAAIRRVVQSLTDAWNAGDGEAFAAPFAADADYVVINGMQLKGRDVIGQKHAEIFSAIYRESRIAGVVRSVRLLRRDVAVMHVEWNLEFRANGQPGRVHAINTLVLTKDGGTWSIAAFHNTPIQPQVG